MVVIDTGLALHPAKKPTTHNNTIHRFPRVQRRVALVRRNRFNDFDRLYFEVLSAIIRIVLCIGRPPNIGFVFFLLGQIPAAGRPRPVGSSLPIQAV
ncbi:MAG: hypothetical protein JW810_05540 [Sedimentisphaerales bacterium]|nr:hypothetical protein [Sedimentisphaerales bacterium]